MSTAASADGSATLTITLSQADGETHNVAALNWC